MVNTTTNNVVSSFKNLIICNEKLDKIEYVDLALCTQIADNHLLRLQEWVEYHRLIGFQRIYVYIDSPNFAKYKFLMDGYMKKHRHILTLVPFYFKHRQRPQQAVLHDCLYRMKVISKYVAFFDADEFLQGMTNISLKQYLDATISDEIPVVSILNWPFSNLRNTVPKFHEGFLESYKFRTRTPVVGARQKIIGRSDSLHYAGIHRPNGGENLIESDANNGLRIVHFRYPPLGEWLDAKKKKKEINNFFFFSWQRKVFYNFKL